MHNGKTEGCFHTLMSFSVFLFSTLCLQIGALKDYYHFYHSRTIKRSVLSSRGTHSFISMEPKVRRTSWAAWGWGEAAKLLHFLLLVITLGGMKAQMSSVSYYPQVCCHTTYSNERRHDLIFAGIPLPTRVENCPSKCICVDSHTKMRGEGVLEDSCNVINTLPRMGIRSSCSDSA